MRWHSRLSQTSNSIKLYLLAAAAGASAAALVSCTNSGSQNDGQQEYFHADRDIAMTLGSLLDAIRVGEALDSTVYNFVGVLTDGEGAPLYTDSDLYPGQWEVLVVNSDSAVIRNLKSGNIRVQDLQNYIAENLQFRENDIREVIDTDDDDEIEEIVYSFTGGCLRFEILEEYTPLNEEGPFLNISVSRN